MCGRYQFTVEESAELREIVKKIYTKNLQAQWHTGEIFPTDNAPVLLPKQAQIEPALMRWGFPNTKNSRIIINARAETAAGKKTFAASLERCRCVVPSSGFYEWDTEKQKYLFRLPEQDTLYMAGIWDLYAGERRFCILTTEGNESISDIHCRMPVVLPKTQAADWLFYREAARDILAAVPPMLTRENMSTQTKLW